MIENGCRCKCLTCFWRVQSENCFAAVVGTSTPTVVHGSRSPLRKQHGTKTRTEHEEPRCAELQLARRKPPALPTTSETLVDEAESRKTIEQFGVRVFIIS